MRKNDRHHCERHARIIYEIEFFFEEDNAKSHGKNNGTASEDRDGARQVVMLHDKKLNDEGDHGKNHREPHGERLKKCQIELLSMEDKLANQVARGIKRLRQNDKQKELYTRTG